MNCRRLALLIACCAVGLSVTQDVHAQSNEIKLNRFNPAVQSRDGFSVNRPTDQAHLQLGAQIVLDYANDALVYELVQSSSDSERYSVIQHQLTGHLILSLGLYKRLVLFAGLPVNFMMEGDSLPANVGLRADGFGVSDPWFGARLRLVGERSDFASLALQATATAPLAEALDEDEQFAGESRMTFHPQMLLELRPSILRIVLNAGTRFREKGRIDNLRLGHELTFNAGVIVPILKGAVGLDAHAEAYGATAFSDFGDRELTPFEAIAGAKLHWGRWTWGAAGGPGFGRGIGTPDFRLIAMLGYGPEEKEAEKPKDSDGDGLFDKADKCPWQAEDQDGFEDSDGCPEHDNDRDGIPDAKDKCPLQAEDKDNFQDEDGCPETDNDRDGIPDAQDKCPLEAEDKDNFQDEDGCPDLDNDGDGIPDAEDECPLVPGKPEDKGCLKHAKVDEAQSQIVISERLEFATGEDKVLRRSEPILFDIKTILDKNPNLKRVRVEGHTDSRGSHRTNMKLSRKRVQTILRWFKNTGLDVARFEGWACGEGLPRESNATTAGRQSNRRVEFHILDPEPASGARQAPGCEPFSLD